MEVFKAFNSNSRNEIKGLAVLLLGFAVVREEPWRLLDNLKPIQDQKGAS